MEKDQASVNNSGAPDHYLELGLTPWEAFDRGWLTKAEFVGHLRGVVLEYVARAPHKNGVADYRKAIRCLTKLVSLLADEGDRT